MFSQVPMIGFVTWPPFYANLVKPGVHQPAAGTPGFLNYFSADVCVCVVCVCLCVSVCPPPGYEKLFT